MCLDEVKFETCSDSDDLFDVYSTSEHLRG